MNDAPDIVTHLLDSDYNLRLSGNVSSRLNADREWILGCFKALHPIPDKELSDFFSATGE